MRDYSGATEVVTEMAETFICVETSFNGQPIFCSQSPILCHQSEIVLNAQAKVCIDQGEWLADSHNHRTS